ncbi:GNAT family N-acetyltransferase [Kordia sp. YSTF-M3]|uniref:GNAT family N-acetyltransferase n=1 Tax=Kordia aestuariivivens TaxID=2759037 RepID=A0ABR7Q688_9FLAO|nr:GNAT family N-acetyltransferase [Kordia aestuariivivens]MBC8753861.1 GNAT family N-acetyltransferase [Kordia aestuariivivens]
MTTYNIRFAKKEDIPQIIELCAAHAEFEQASYDADGKAELLKKHLFISENSVKCLVVEANQELVGYATFIKQFSTWDANHYVYLDCLFMKDKTRNQGLGLQLMEEIKAYAKNEECTIIQWQTPNFNTNAIRFYKRLGATSKNKERFSWSI